MIVLCVKLSLSCHQVAIQRTELHEWTVRYVHREMQSQPINQTTMQLSIANVNKYITWFNYYNPTNGHVHCAAFVYCVVCFCGDSRQRSQICEILGLVIWFSPSSTSSSSFSSVEVKWDARAHI